MVRLGFLQALRDRYTLSPDESSEAALGDGCGFTEEEIAAVAPPVVEEIDESD